MRPKHSTLTPQELEIMKLVWESDSATVRDVYEALLKQRKIAYTTVMTMMKILETKGYLKKRRQDRAFVIHTGDGDTRIVLLRAVHVVRKAVVDRDMIKLGRRLVVHRAPGHAPVKGDRGPAIAGFDDPVGVCGVDPDPMVIAMARR